MKEAVKNRHTVREYTDEPLSEELIDLLADRLEELNEEYEINLKLMVNDPRAFGPLFKTVLAKNVNNYLILSGPSSEDLDEILGYCAADFMLYAQTLGLNTWFVATTYSKGTVSRVSDGEKVSGIIAVGHGAVEGKPHKSKSIDDVSAYNGDAPDWFTEGVRTALYAPTALNKQNFFITGTEDKVKITCNNGRYTKLDLGIVEYYFELGAGGENFEWLD